MLNENSKENLMARVFLSLGSNKGDRLANIQQAVSMLGMTEDINIVKTSSFYETEPWGNPELKLFLNATLALDTNIKPLDLLKFCKRFRHILYAYNTLPAFILLLVCIMPLPRSH